MRILLPFGIKCIKADFNKTKDVYLGGNYRFK